MVDVSDFLAHSPNVTAGEIPPEVEQNLNDALEDLNPTLYGTDTGQAGGGGNDIPTQGLVGYWPLDGDAHDYVGGADGTTHGDLSFSPGQRGSAVRLDGTDDYIDLGTSLSTSFSTLTVAAWIKNGSDGGGFQAIVERNYWNAADGFGLFVDNQRVSWGHYSGGPTVTSTQTVRDGEWHHVAGTLEPDGTDYRYRIFVDGAPEGSKTIGRSVSASSAKTGIGRRIANFSGDYYFEGMIDEVRVYDQALNPSEVGRLAGATITEGGT